MQIQKTLKTSILSKKAIQNYLKQLTSKGGYFYASDKKYHRLFGRDSIITSLELLPWFPKYAKNTLEVLSKLQGAKGQIIHENVNGINKETRWDSLDSTPLFLILAFEYFSKTNDKLFIKKILPNIEEVLRWIENYGDHDKDGFMEYHKNSKGLAHHCWKDSVNGIIDKEGKIPKYPIAPAEVQGYLYKAYKGISKIYLVFGSKEEASKYQKKAKKLRELFNKKFWLEKEKFFALALDGNKRPVNVISSNIGHILWSGIIDEKKIEPVVVRLLKNDIFTKFGLRTLSSEMGGFKPKSYHNGSIWPFDNWFFAEGLEKYGYKKEANIVRKSILKALEILGSPYECYTLIDNKLGLKLTTRDNYSLKPEKIQAWTVGAMWAFIMKLSSN